MRLSIIYFAAAVMAVALPIASMSAPAAGAQPTSEKQATQQSQISKPSTTTSQSKMDRKNNGQQEVDPSAQNQGNLDSLRRSVNDLKEAKDVEGNHKAKLLEIAYAAFDKNSVLEQGQSTSNFLTDHSLSLRHLTAQQKAALSLQPYQLMAK